MTAVSLLALVAMLSIPSCGPIPKDPEKTTERILAGTMRVGVSENPPWIRRNGEEADGIEADLIRSLAQTMSARVEWVWGIPEDHYHGLEKFEIDLVAGGLTAETPWKARVGMTRPWVEVPLTVGVPPGHAEIETIDGSTVGWSSPPHAPALLRERGAVPVRVDPLRSHGGPVLAPAWWVEGNGWTDAGLILDHEKHVMFVPPGENRWLVRVERFLLEHEAETWQKLREGATR